MHDDMSANDNRNPFDTPLVAMLRQEMLRTLRDSRSFLFLLFTTGVVILIAYVALPAKMTPMNTGGAARALFVSYGSFLFLVAATLIPALGAMNLCIERQRDTFDFLRLTELTPWDIAFAKMAALFGFYLLLSLATLPVIGVLFFMVGVETGQFLQVVGISMLTALTGTVVGLSASARYTLRGKALLIAFFGMLVFMGPVVIVAGTIATFGLAGPVLLVVYAFISPVAALVHAFLSTNWIVFTASSAYQSVYAWRSFRDTVLLVGNPPVPMPGRDLPESERGPVIRASGTGPARFGPRVRNWLATAYGGFRGEIYGITIVLFVLVTLSVVALSDERTPPLTFLLVVSGGAAVVLPGLFGAHFAREYERGTMDMLRMTLLTPRALIYRQLRGELFKILPLAFGAVTGSLPLLTVYRVKSDVVFPTLAGNATLLLCCWLSVCVSQFAGIFSRTSMRALLYSYFMHLLVFIGVLAGFDYFSVWLRWIDVPYTSMQGALSPVMPLLWPLIHEHSGDALWWSVWAWSFSTYLALSFLLVEASVWLYRKSHERDR